MIWLIFWLPLRFAYPLFSAPDARASFLLSRQEKGAKEKATPPHRRIDKTDPVPCAAHRAGRLRNSPSLREDSDSPRRLPPARLRCSAGQKGEGSRTGALEDPSIRRTPTHALCGAEQRRARQKNGEDCLRPAGPSSAAPAVTE